MKHQQTQTWSCLATATHQQVVLRSLSNAQYFLRELVQHYAFSITDIAQKTRIKREILEDLYALKINILSVSNFKKLLQLYCAVIRKRVSPQWYQKATESIPN